MQLCLLLGNERVADVNAVETGADMALGDAERYLIGIFAAMIMLQVVGKHIIKWQSLRVVLMCCPTAKFFAFPVIRTQGLMAEANYCAEQALYCSAN